MTDNTNTLTVFPVNSKKEPAVGAGTSWKDYKGKAETSMVGIMIPRGIIIIDQDTYKSDVDEEKIETALGCKLNWEESALQLTLSGGKHNAFRVPIDSDLINGANVLGVSGFDTRSAGKGYIATGEGYTDLTMFGVIETLTDPQDLPELPEEAVRRLSAGGVVSFSDDEFAALDVSINSAIDESLTIDDVREYVALLPDSEAENNWLATIQAIHHQTRGSEEGWEIADEFSKRCMAKYNKKKNRIRWESLGRNLTKKQITFESIKSKVRALGIKEDTFDNLLTEASSLSTVKEYNDFKEKIINLKVELKPDEIGMIASEIKSSNVKGISKTALGDIKKALIPDKKSASKHTERPSWSREWVYLEKQARFSKLSNPDYNISREAFDMKYANKLEGESPSRYLAENEGFLTKAYDSMFLPQQFCNDPFFILNGKRYLNAYSPSGYFEMKAKGEKWYTDSKAEEAVSTFLEHCSHIVSDERERDILISFMAYPLKNLGERVNWMLLLQGSQGSGKSYFSNVLQKILNGRYVNQVGLKDIEGRFNSFAVGSIFNIIEEMRINGTNKLEVSDNLKPLLSNDTIAVERKGIDSQTVQNTASYIGFTNHKNALILSEDDRRYAVIHSDIQDKHTMEKVYGGNSRAYFKRLFDALDDGGAYAIGEYLVEIYNIPDWFDPKGRAPETKGTKRMVALSVTNEMEALDEKMEAYKCDIINESLFCITEFNKQERASNLDNDADFVELSSRTLSALLSSKGYDKAETRVKVGRKNYYFWVKGISEEEGKNRIRAFYGDYDLENVPENMFDNWTDVPF